MSFPVRRRAQEEAELFAHIDWIAERNPQAAIRFADAIEATFTLLSAQSEIGAPHSATNPRLAGLRKWDIPTFQNYLHVYRGEKDYVDDLESDG